jgi:glucosamine--fructose-6-phosphate aminotransferase (isomerizing)
VNVTTSTIAREAGAVMPTLAGPEIGVASTKAFTAQLMALLLLAVHIGRQRGVISAAREQELVDHMTTVPRLMAETLKAEADIAAVAADLADSRNALFLGRGQMFPMALEAALKLKEVSYIHAEGYAAGELKHGPIALIDEAMPVIALAPNDVLREKMHSNLSEVMARKGRVVILGQAGHLGDDLGTGVWRSIQLPACDGLLTPFIYAVAVQLLAYHVANTKGTDVDQPRNLAKSVTVE